MPFVITSLEPPLPLTIGETAELTIILTATQPRSSRNYQEYIPRLTIGGEPVNIRACNWRKDKGAIGVDCGFTLADIADRALIAADASLTFEVGIKEQGITTWKTIAALQRLSQRSFNISGDTLTFQSVSGVTEKLNTSPIVPFIMYDPDKVLFDAAAVDKLYDTEGRIYPVEAIPISGLMIYDIFQEIFVERCGFESYWTDIENCPVSQISVDVTDTFLGALNPIIEPFAAPNEEGPLFVEVDGELKIFDTSKFIPAGFPTPRDLTIWGCSSLSINTAYSDVVAAKMVFSVPNSWDFATNRISVSNLPTGNGLFTLSVQNIWELRSFAEPEVVMDERLQFAWEYVSTILGLQVSQEIQTFFFDSYARPLTSTIERWARLPDGSGPSTFIGHDPDEVEVQLIGYAQHPSRIGRQFQQSITRTIAGRIAVDADNPYLDSPFRQPLRLAHWVGNANEGITVEQGNLRTYKESVAPQRNGQVIRSIVDYDHVRDLPITSRREPQVADVSLNGDNSKSRDVIVTETGAAYTGGRVITIHTGPLPIEIATPLVRRKLRKMRTLSQEASLNIIGVDPTVAAGAMFAASDKLEEVEGNFLCTAYSGSGENLGTAEAVWSMTVEGMEI
jgi:hypothetical protein